MQGWMIFLQLLVQLESAVRLPVFWMMMALLALQTGCSVWRNESMIWKQKQVVYWLPAFLLHILEQLLTVLLAAMLGGVVAGTLLLLTGVSVELTAIPCLWLLMLLLFCVQRRFICFAYAGGILVLMQYLTGLFAFDGRQLLMLIAVLHFTEAILVYTSGTLQAHPVYLRSSAGRTICRTELQMTWPIPLVMPMPIYTAEPFVMEQGCIVMPDWWPLFSTSVSGSEAAVYCLLPMIAVIGYHDMAMYRREKQHSAVAAGLLLCYSVMLGILVLLSRNCSPLVLFTALFAIIGHEAIARIRH